MKKLNYFMKVVFSITLLLSLTSCPSDDDYTPPSPRTQTNIIETIQNIEGLSILSDVVSQAELVNLLSADGNKTVLAPTNAAFLEFLEMKGFSSLSEVPNDVLTQVLANHVIDGTNYQSSDLNGVTGYEKTLADGPNSTKLSIFYDGTDGLSFNGISTVTFPNVAATNGIIHLVDAVIDIPTIATFATSNPELGSLVSSLSYADSGTPTVPYIETVSNSAAEPLTVFAPINDGFAEVLSDTCLSEIEDLETDVVDDILLNHIVDGNILSSDLTSDTVSTLGDDILIDATEFTITDSNERVINIVTTLVDIQAVNGVVHVVDRVVLPILEQPTPNIVDVAQSESNLSMLVEAVIQAELVDILTTCGERTVFAPTNDAFMSFLLEKGFTAISDVPNEILSQIISNHIIDGVNIESESLSETTGYANTMAIGPNETNLSLYYDGNDGVTINGISSVLTPDVEATNGIIHIVDAVIDLPTIATFATSNPALTTLVEALLHADSGTPTIPYISTVSDATTGPYTVFAPTNDAFSSLLTNELGIGTLITNLDTSTLDDILLLHIVDSNVQSSELMTGTVTTLGGDIEADTTGFTLTDENGRVSNIITTLVDIQSINGVVHVIDKVILPLQ